MRRLVFALAMLALVAGSATAGIFGDWGRPTIKGAEDVIDTETPFTHFYYGVDPGVAFEDFLGATSGEDLLLTANFAVELPDHSWLEAGPAMVGDDEPEVGMRYRLGRRLVSSGTLGLYVGGAVLRNGVTEYGGFAFAKQSLSPAHDVRLSIDVDDDGDVGVSFGFLWVETRD